jgi:predicted transcriptional regulator
MIEQELEIAVELENDNVLKNKNMALEKVLKKYTRQQVADLLGVTRQAVYYWVKNNNMPKLRQYELLELEYDKQTRNISKV